MTELLLNGEIPCASGLLLNCCAYISGVFGRLGAIEVLKAREIA